MKAVSAPILERARLLEVVAGYLGEAAAGHGRLVFVAGDAGAGKTAFVAPLVAVQGGRGRGRRLRRIADGSPARPAGRHAAAPSITGVAARRRRAHTLRALMVVTYRPHELPADHPLRVQRGDAATAQGARRLDLPPLSVDAVHPLAERSETTVRDPVELHRVTGGNPFFVTEVLVRGR